MYNPVSVYKQQCSYLHAYDDLKNLCQYVFHENWDINSNSELKYNICNNINSSQKVSQACIISKSWVVSAIIKKSK